MCAGQRACARWKLFVLRRVKRCQPFTDSDVIYLGESWFSSLPCLGIGRRQVIVKLFEVALVVAKGMLAEVAFVAQVLEKLG